MGGSAPIVDGLSVESGRPTGVQHRAPVNTRGPWPNRHFRGTDRDAVQLVLRLYGAARRLGWRPFQPQVANSVFMLVLMRSVATGGGEAFFGPANYSLLGQYHTDTRARAMSIHQTAYYIGVILAGWLAGLIADRFDALHPGEGWKYSFIFFGAAGIVWGILMALRLKDKPLNDEEKKARKGNKPGILDGFKTVFTNPTAACLTFGFSGLIFVITGYMTWMPAYLQDECGLSQASAGFNSMFWTYVAAFIGVLLSGSLSDRLAARSPKHRMLLQAAGLLLGAVPLFVIGHVSTLWVLYLCFAVWGFFRAMFDANTYSVLYDVTPPHLHA